MSPPKCSATLSFFLFIGIHSFIFLFIGLYSFDAHFVNYIFQSLVNKVVSIFLCPNDEASISFDLSERKRDMGGNSGSSQGKNAYSQPIGLQNLSWDSRMLRGRGQLELLRINFDTERSLLVFVTAKGFGCGWLHRRLKTGCGHDLASERESE